MKDLSLFTSTHVTGLVFAFFGEAMRYCYQFRSRPSFLGLFLYMCTGLIAGHICYSTIVYFYNPINWIVLGLTTLAGVAGPQFMDNIGPLIIRKVIGISISK